MFPVSTRDIPPNTRVLFSPRELSVSEQFVTTNKSHEPVPASPLERTAGSRHQMTTVHQDTYRSFQQVDNSHLHKIDYGYGKGPEEYSCGKTVNQSYAYRGGTYHPASFTHRKEDNIDKRVSPAGFTPTRYRQEIMQRVWKQDESRPGMITVRKKRDPIDVGVGNVAHYGHFSPKRPGEHTLSTRTPPWEMRSIEKKAYETEYLTRRGSPRVGQHLTTSIKSTDVAHLHPKNRRFKTNPPYEAKQWPFDMIPKSPACDLASIDTTSRNVPRPVPPQTAAFPKMEAKPVFDGTFCRDPSSDRLFDTDGDGDIDDDDRKMDLLIGKFLHEKDDQKRSEMRYLEGKRVMIQQLLLHGYRRQINQFDPAFKGKHMEEIVEMISGKSDFEEYIAHLQRDYVNNPMEVTAFTQVDVDGDGIVDAEEIHINSIISDFSEVEDARKRLELKQYEGRYIMALDMINADRNNMWMYDAKFRQMSQKEILNDLVNDKLFHDRMSEFKRKANNLKTRGSKQLIAVMGGSKDWLPVKAQMTAREEEMMNSACVDKVYDRIVDHEGAFLKKHQGYSNMSGWLHQLKVCTQAFERLDKFQAAKFPENVQKPIYGKWR